MYKMLNKLLTNRNSQILSRNFKIPDRKWRMQIGDNFPKSEMKKKAFNFKFIIFMIVLPIFYFFKFWLRSDGFQVLAQERKAIVGSTYYGNRIYSFF